MNLANIITKICELLTKLTKSGLLYANLRVENIMINLKTNMKEINGIRFLNFGNILKFDDIDLICIP